MGQEDIIRKTVAGVSLAMLSIVMIALILNGIFSASVFTNIDASATVVNETGGCINATGCYVDNYLVGGFTNVAITEIINVTDNVTILSGNYTISTDGLITNLTVANYDSILTSYTYDYGTNTTLSGINVTALKAKFWLFILGIISMFVVGATIIGIVWLLPYIKPLFKKENGLGAA